MSYYLNYNTALERLRREWREHNGLIVAVDFDSTLCPYRPYEVNVDSDLIRSLVRELHHYGCTIIIWTAAEDERHESIKEWLKKNNIPFDHFNEDSPKTKYKSRKVYANAFLDDRAGLLQMYTTLSQLLTEVKYEHCKRHCEQLEYGAKATTPY